MAEESKLETFEQRYNFDISKFVEKKVVEGKSKATEKEFRYELSYLSWAYAQKMGMELDPNFDWYPEEREDGSLNWFGMVKIIMTFKGKKQKLNFPILDSSNRAIVKNPDAFDINTAQMRGMAKLFSMMSGIGLTLYTGEDIKAQDLSGDHGDNKEKSAEEENKKEQEKEKHKQDRYNKINWLNKKCSSGTDEEKEFLNAQLKERKRKTFLNCSDKDLNEIGAKFKETFPPTPKDPADECLAMVEYIEERKEKHKEVINEALKRNDEPFVNMLNKEPLKQLYDLIKGKEEADGKKTA